MTHSIATTGGTIGLAAIALAGLAASTAPAQPASRPANRPNVILIYTDDQDRESLGCYGGDAATPAMDSLARDGMRFTRFYVAAPVCTPSRYNVLSGRYASRSLRQQKVCPPGGPINIGWDAGVLNEKILPQALQEAGYVTGLSGKWHVGLYEEPTYMPSDADPREPKIKQLLLDNYASTVRSIKRCGFDYVAGAYGLNPGSGGKTPLKMFWLPDVLHKHNMEWVTEGALEFIEQNRGKPFFLYIAPTLPHAPPAPDSLRSDPRISAKGYLDTPPNVPLSRQDIIERTRGMEAKQAAVYWLDVNVGVILKKLDDLGLAENTVVFLASDNGRTGKFCCYDGGARTLLLARWKGKIPAGKVAHPLASNIDLAPTILDLCGVKKPADLHVDGQSLKPLLTGGDYHRESIFIEITTERAVVTDDGFKYIAVRYPPDIQEKVDQGMKYDHWCRPYGGSESNVMGADTAFPGYFDQDQLYDLNTDPNEQRNLARDPKYRERLDAMKKRLREYSARLPHQFGEFTSK